MSTVLRHFPHRIVAEMLWRNRGIGTDPAWWDGRLIDSLSDADALEVESGLHDWPVRYGGEGAQPDRTITCYTTAGVVQAKILLTGEQVKNHGVTVRVRGTTEDEVSELALSIEKDLNEGAHDQTVTIAGQQYLVQSFPRAEAIPAFRMAFGARSLWVANVNCLAVILAYPLTG